MNKNKKVISVVSTTVACVIIAIVLILSIPRMERQPWILSYAQKADAPYLVVAHGADYNVSNINDPMFSFSEPVEVILESKDGELLLTDKTNGKTYEGTYKLNSGKYGRFRTFRTKSYTVVIDGLEGTANFSSRRTLFVSVGGYYLTFDVK